jgi:hypothetical protein
LLEDTTVISSTALTRVRRLGLALLLLAVPACGLSDYEKLMRDAQERKERFDAEQKYLGKPVIIPTRKDEKDKDVAIATAFFRPPKGIDSKPQPLNDVMWRYKADPRNSDFQAVDMAFAEDSKDFADKVLTVYGGLGKAGSAVQITPPGQETAMLFDHWEIDKASVNILRGSSKPVAVVYIYKARPDSTRRAIEQLSLQSLGVGQGAGAARQRANEKSPWKLEGAPSSP